MTLIDDLVRYLERCPEGASYSQMATAIGSSYNSVSAIISQHAKDRNITKLRPGVYGVPKPEPPVKEAPKKVITKSAKEPVARKKRIAWTQEESEAVAGAMFVLWEKYPAAGFTGDICERAMRAALPADRWRAFAGLSQSPGVQEALNSRIRKALEHPVAAPVVAVAPAPVEPPPPAPAPTPVTLNDFPFEEVEAHYFIRRAHVEARHRQDISAFVELLFDQNARQTQPPLPAVPVPQPSPPLPPLKPIDDRLRVFVCGLLGGQAHNLRMEIDREHYPINLIKTVQGGEKGQHVPSSAQAVVINSKMGNHRDFHVFREEALKQGSLFIPAMGPGKVVDAIRILAGGKRHPSDFSHLVIT